MKINKTFLHWAIPGTLTLATVFTLVAWKGGPQQPGSTDHNSRDTIPNKERTRITREPGDRDLDKELRQLDAAKESLKEVDWEKIQQSVETAMKSVNMEQIQRQVEQSMKQVDMEKIQQQVQESLKKVDYDKIRQDVTEALKNVETQVDKEEIKKEIEEAMKEVKKELKNEDWKKEMEEVKKVNMKEVQEEMKNAHVEIKKAKEELKGYQEMIYSMEKDGLLSTKEDYNIGWKKGELTINDKKQPAEIANRYSKYFKKDTVIIKKENGDVEIKHNEKHFN